MRQNKKWTRRSAANLFVVAILAISLLGCGQDDSMGQVTIGASANNPNLFAQSSSSLFDSMWAFAFGREAVAEVPCSSPQISVDTDGNPGTAEICITEAFADLRKVDLNPFDDGLPDVTMGRDVGTVNLLGIGPLSELTLIGTFPVPAGIYKELRFKIDGTQGESLSPDLPGDTSIFIKGDVMNSAGASVMFEFSTELNERLDLLIPESLSIDKEQTVQYTFFFDLQQVFSLPNIVSGLTDLADTNPGGVVLEESSGGAEKVLQELIKDALDDRIDLNTDSGLSIGTFTPCPDPCV